MSETSLHIAVHRILTIHACENLRMIERGTEGMIGRAQCHFDRSGDSQALGLLARSNVALFRLRQALRSSDKAEAAAQRAELLCIADDWREQTPLFEVAQLFPTDGSA